MLSSAEDTPVGAFAYFGNLEEKLCFSTGKLHVQNWSFSNQNKTISVVKHEKRENRLRGG